MYNSRYIEEDFKKLLNKTADGEKVLHYLHTIEENTRRFANAMERIVEILESEEKN